MKTIVLSQFKIITAFFLIKAAKKMSGVSQFLASYQANVLFLHRKPSVLHFTVC